MNYFLSNTVHTLISLTRTSGRCVFFRSLSYFSTCLCIITSNFRL